MVASWQLLQLGLVPALAVVVGPDAVVELAPDVAVELAVGHGAAAGVVAEQLPLPGPRACLAFAVTAAVSVVAVRFGLDRAVGSPLVAPVAVAAAVVVTESVA